MKRVLKALVTGSTGFIGSHLVEGLVQREVQVRCLVRKTSDLKWLRGLPIEFVYGDCNDRGSLKEAVKDVDQLFHLAGVTKAIDEKTYFEVNALGTDNLIHACLEYSPCLQKFIYLSSQAAAGPCCNGRGKKESDECKPISPYGQSKRMGEKLAIEHAHELPLLILRPSAVYGPRDKDFYVLFKLLSKKIKPCLAGQLSLCYVQDIIQAILLASESQESKGEIFFLSDGHDYRMDEVGNILPRQWESAPFPFLFPNGSYSESPPSRSTFPSSPGGLLSSAKVWQNRWSNRIGVATSQKPEPSSVLNPESTLPRGPN